MKIALVAQQPTDGDRIRLRELRRALVGAGQRVSIDMPAASGNTTPADAAGADASGADVTGVDATSAGEAGLALRGDGEPLAGVPGLAARLRARWARERPDVVHAVRWTSGLAALGAARDLGIPVVQSFGSLAVAERRHAIAAGGPRPAVPPAWGRPHRAPAAADRIRLEAAIARSAAAVIAASSGEAADLVRIGVPRRAITVVPCGVDPAAFTPDRPDGPDGLASSPGNQARHLGGPRRLLTVSGPAGHVGIAIRALPRVPGAELVVAGGPDHDVLGGDEGYLRLTALAKALGVDDRVRFTGEVSRGELPALLRSADLLLAAPGYDPDGTAALEAMACGLPVVACAAGGALPDIIIDGTTGILLPAARPDLLASRVRQLLAHPMLLSGMCVAAADRARSRYSWDRIAAETLSAYARVASATTAAAAA